MTFFADERIRLAGVVAAVVLAADQLTKWIVDATMAPDGQIAVLPVFALTYTRNPGAAFGILAAVPPGVRLPLFFAITIVAVGAVLSFIRKTPPHERWLVGALGGVIGGALGNLVCRVRYGEVIDFLDVHWETLYACVNPAACRWPAFNVADSAITVGVAIVLLHGLRHGQEADRPAASAGR